MKKAICQLLLEINPNIVEFADLRSTYIANCVFNNFLSYTAIMLNIVTILIAKAFKNIAPESYCF